MERGNWMKIVMWLVLLLQYSFKGVRANAEVNALHAVKRKLIDPNNVLQSWDPKLEHPCTWYHITCNTNNNVTRVDLGGSGLSGELATELGQLNSLQHLFLYDNKISGTSIPAGLGNLVNLMFLGLHKNNLTGPIPDTIGGLTTLKNLTLFSNNLTGPIPSSLGDLTNLETLDLYSNRLSGPIPDSLGQLSKLNMLRVHKNMLTGTIPMSLTGIPNLEIVDFRNNNLSGVVPTTGSFLRLTPLSFANNPNLCYPLQDKPCT